MKELLVLILIILFIIVFKFDIWYILTVVGVIALLVVIYTTIRLPIELHRLDHWLDQS